MRNTPFVVALVGWAGLGLVQTGAAQTAPGSTIHTEAAAAPRPVAGGVSPALIEDGVNGNTAVGVEALFSNSGAYNTASGFQTLYSNTTGFYNTASGAQALFSNTTGYFNTASGFQALVSNSGGHRNTASGMSALASNTTGDYNVASGFEALRDNITGESNTASGAYALSANDSGYQNTASGSFALYRNTSGYHNTASGMVALYSNTTGNANTASGEQALYYNTTGHLNVAYGVRAGREATTGSYNLFLGAEVWGTPSDTNTIRIGLPYTGGTGQNQTFIAGIHGTQVTAGPVLPVYVDANGQLGTMGPGGPPGGWIPAASMARADATIARLEQQSRDQQTMIADLRAKFARLEALVARAAGRK